MPQATEELRARWHSDAWHEVGDELAWAQLGKNFTDSQGMIRPSAGYTPTEDDLSAIDYLCQEWDYGYSGA